MKLSKEIKVALLGITAIVALYLGFLFLKGSSIFSTTNTYYVIYDNVNGLTVSNPVVLSGIGVGTVKDMKILQNRGNKVLVTLDINKDVVVGDSTIASLSSSDLLGSKAIVLFAGRHQRIYEAGGDTLISYVEQSFTDMLSQKSMPLLGSIDTTLMHINDFFASDAKRSIKAIILNTEATTEALKNTLVSNQQNVQAITANMAALTASLQESERKFSRIAGNLAEITDTLKNTEISAVVRSMNSTAQEAHTLVQKMNSETGSLGKLINNDSVYQNLNNSSANLNKLMIDIRERPNRYVSFSVIGRRDKVVVDKAPTAASTPKNQQTENVTTE